MSLYPMPAPTPKLLFRGDAGPPSGRHPPDAGRVFPVGPGSASGRPWFASARFGYDEGPGRMTGAFLRGADDEIRTRDPHLGKVMLYQLSHVRTCCSHYNKQ